MNAPAIVNHVLGSAFSLRIGLERMAVIIGLVKNIAVVVASGRNFTDAKKQADVIAMPVPRRS